MEQSVADILKEAKTIAIIGCSENKYRTSNHIASYLQNAGYKIIPVHPDYEEVLGEKAYDSVTDIPQEVRVDIVDIFRNSDYTADMVDEIIERVEATGDHPVVWTQLGVSSDEAKQKAEKAGLTYIEEKCMMVEHRRFIN